MPGDLPDPGFEPAFLNVSCICPLQGGDTHNLPPANSSDPCLLGPPSSWDYVVSVGTLQIAPSGAIPGEDPSPHGKHPLGQHLDSIHPECANGQCPSLPQTHSK